MNSRLSTIFLFMLCSGHCVAYGALNCLDIFITRTPVEQFMDVLPSYSTKRTSLYEEAAYGVTFSYSTYTRGASQHYINGVIKSAYQRLNLPFSEARLRSELASVNDLRETQLNTEVRALGLNKRANNARAWARDNYVTSYTNFVKDFLNKISDPNVSLFFINNFRSNIFQINYRFSESSVQLIIVPLFKNDATEPSHFLFIKTSSANPDSVTQAKMLTVEQMKTISETQSLFDYLFSI